MLGFYERWDIGNLRTFCHICHTHAWFEGVQLLRVFLSIKTFCHKCELWSFFTHMFTVLGPKNNWSKRKLKFRKMNHDHEVLAGSTVQTSFSVLFEIRLKWFPKSSTITKKTYFLHTSIMLLIIFNFNIFKVILNENFYVPCFFDWLFLYTRILLSFSVRWRFAENKESKQVLFLVFTSFWNECFGLKAVARYGFVKSIQLFPNWLLLLKISKKIFDSRRLKKSQSSMDLGLTRVDLLQTGLTYPKTAKLLPPPGAPSQKQQQKVSLLPVGNVLPRSLRMTLLFLCS